VGGSEKENGKKCQLLVEAGNVGREPIGIIGFFNISIKIGLY
jgi:hypothetical protein